MTDIWTVYTIFRLESTSYRGPDSNLVSEVNYINLVISKPALHIASRTLIPEPSWDVLLTINIELISNLRLRFNPLTIFFLLNDYR